MNWVYNCYFFCHLKSLHLDIYVILIKDKQLKIPKVFINVRVKVKTVSPEETAIWNKVFGYIMRKPRTKLEFLTIASLRNLPLSKFTLAVLKPYLKEEDYLQLQKVEDLFNTRLTTDLKAFILGVLRIPYKTLLDLSKLLA